MSIQTNKKDFFISYSSKDEKAATWVAYYLEELGYSTIFQSWDISTEIDLIHEMNKFIKCCKKTIAIISENYLNSKFCMLEYHNAFDSKTLIPIKIDNCNIKKLRGQLVYLDLTDIEEREALERLYKYFSNNQIKPSKKPEYKGFLNRKEIVPVKKNLEVTDKNEILNFRANEAEKRLKETINNNYYMTLNIQLEVEKEIEYKDEKTDKVNKIIQKVWEDIDISQILNDDKNYLIVSPSGMGKTTFLRYIAKELLQNNYNYLPLNLTCIDINGRQGNLNNFLDEKIEEYYTNSTSYLISENRNNLCLLIDALDQAINIDEIIHSLISQNIETQYKKSKIILSSRPESARRIDKSFLRVRLVLNEIDQVKRYLGQKNFEEIKKFMDITIELIYTPVLLEMLKIVAEQGGLNEEINNKSELYDQFTNKFIEQEKRKARYWHNKKEVDDFLSYELEKHLERIAFYAMVNNEILEIEISSLNQFGLSEQKKQALFNIGILLEFFEDEKQKLIFRHQSFQAYFAARYLYFQDKNNFNLKKILKNIGYFYSDEWFEVLQYYFGLIKQPEELKRNVNLINQLQPEETDIHKFLRTTFSLMLVSHSFVKSEFIDDLYDYCYIQIINNKVIYTELFNNIINKFNKFNFLQQKLVKEKIIIPLFNDENKWVKAASAEILEKMVTSKDIDLIKLFLKDEGWRVRRAGAEALSQIETQKDIDLIKPLIFDKNSLVRTVGIKILKKLITSNDIEFLLYLLEDKNRFIRSVGIRALGKLGNSKDIKFVLPLLLDENPSVRKSGIEALAELVTSKDIKLIVRLLGDEDIRLKRAGANAIGKIGTSKDIKFIMPLLKDKNIKVRKIGEGALSKIVTTKDIELIKLLLNDEDSNVRKIGAEALGKTGASRDINLIMPLLKEKDSKVRIAAAETIGRIGTSKDIELVISLLKAGGWKERKAGAETIGKIGTSKDIELVIPILNDNHRKVRKAAAFTIGEIGTSKDIELIVPLLSDKYGGVRIASAKALGKILTSRDINLIIPLLNDDDPNVRKAGAEVLGKIVTPEDINLIMPLLDDEDYNARRAGIEALEKILKLERKELTLDVITCKPVEKTFEQPVQESIINILHFSDLHYKSRQNYDIDHIFNCFLHDVSNWRQLNNDTPFDAVFITGDIAGSGGTKEYAEIINKIDYISKVSSCSKDKFFFIPGNHDVQDYANITPNAENILLKLDADKIKVNDLFNDYNNYKDFIYKFMNYQSFINEIGSINSKFYEEKDIIKPWYSYKLEHLPIRIIGLNSALFTCKGYHSEKNIYMGSRQYKEAVMGFQKELRDAIVNKTVLNEQLIVLAHHPLNWLTKEDKTELTNLMAEHNVIFFHGHTHKKESEVIVNNERKYITIGAGSLYGEGGMNYRNHYQIITISPTNNNIKITGKEWIPLNVEEGGRWELIKGNYDYELPIKIHSNRKI